MKAIKGAIGALFPATAIAAGQVARGTAPASYTSVSASGKHTCGVETGGCAVGVRPMQIVDGMISDAR